jgi:uncharacterized phage protein gp47/JayE
MATLEAGKLYIPESAAVVRNDLLEDYRLAARSFGVTEVSVAPGSDNWFFFTAVANASMLQYANIGTIRPAITPLNATGQDLEDWREALGLPVVGASPASGKLTVGVAPGARVTIPDNQQFIYPSGLRGRVVGTHQNIVDGDDVSVVAIDTGVGTNAEAGTKVRFVNGPFNLDVEARVSVFGPLTGGFDTESEARKRERVLNRLSTSAGGGNWGQLREQAFNALATVQDCYVYPALGGPASCKVVIVKAFEPGRNDFRRAMSPGAVALVADAIHKQNADGMEIVVESVAEQTVNVTFQLDLPDSSLAGGNGLGWVDQTPWPPAEAGAQVLVTNVTDANTITIDAGTTVAPIPGLHHIAWWAKGDQSFYTALITAVGLGSGAGAWTLTLDAPLVDSDGTPVAVGDYISPAAVGLEQYGKTFVELMGQLGAGENCTPASGDVPRRLRHPFISEGAQIGITGKFLADFLRRHPEIEDGVFGYLPVTQPQVPANVSLPPKVLVPLNFAIMVKP